MKNILHYMNSVVLTLKLKNEGTLYSIPLTSGINVCVDAKRYGIRFMANVNQVCDDHIVVSCQSLSKQAAQLHGYSLEISFNRCEDSYFFNSTILGHNPDNELVILTPEKVFKTRRRNDVRLFSQIPVTLKTVDNKDVSASLLPEDINLVTKDISAGGLKLECDATVKNNRSSAVDPETQTANSKMVVEFSLPHATRVINALAEVTWINRVGNRNEIGVRFLNLAPADQQYIVQYIYQEQIRERKKQEGMFYASR